jgi:hypothetical protein
MTPSQYAVILVDSTSHAMRIERLLTQHQIECKLIPVPRQLSSDCGVCVRFLQSEREKVVQRLNDTGIEVQGIFDI